MLLPLVAVVTGCSDLPPGVESNEKIAAGITIAALFDPAGNHEGTTAIVSVSDTAGEVTDAVVVVDDQHELSLDDQGVYVANGLPFSDTPRVSITRGDDFIRVAVPSPRDFTLEVPDPVVINERPTVTWTPADDADSVVLAVIHNDSVQPMPADGDPGTIRSPLIAEAGPYRFSLTKKRHVEWSVVYERAESVTSSTTRGALSLVDITRTTYVDREVQ